MGIGLHGIEHIAGKAVQELLGGGGEFFRMHQIQRLGRLQAFDRLQRRWQSAAGRRSAAGAFIGLGVLGQGGPLAQEKRLRIRAQPFS